MENQGKKWSQLENAETFAFIALLGIAITLLVVGLTSSKSKPKQEFFNTKNK